MPSVFVPATVDRDDPYFNDALFRHWYTRGPVRYHLIPLTHHTYRLLDWTSLRKAPSVLVLGGAINVFVGLIPLVLILFLRVPNRKMIAEDVAAETPGESGDVR